MSLVDEVNLAPLAGDLVRVEQRLRDAVSAEDRFLGEVVAALLAATIGELCRGQVLELQHLFDPDRTAESYLSAIEGKTASLMATACRIGAMVSDVSAD